MRPVYILFECDHFKSLDSQIPIGVFTSKQKLLSTAKKLIKEAVKENPKNQTKAEKKKDLEFQINYFLENSQTSQAGKNYDIIFKEFTANQLTFKI